MAVIQKAGEKALSLGVGMVQVLDQVREFRKRNNTTPVVLMGYANPVERYDQKHGTPGTTGSAFVRDAAAAGVDGVLIVDYPPEECEAFAADLRAHGMDLIFCWPPLLPPNAWPRWHAWPAATCTTYRLKVSQVGVEAAGEGWTLAATPHRCKKAAPACCTGTAPSSCKMTTARSPKPTASAQAWTTPAWGQNMRGCKRSAVPNTWASPTKEALDAFHYLCRTEGIIPALESSHAVAYAMKLAKTMRPDQSILVNLSGRGDKDIGTVADLSGADFYCRPSCQGQSVKGGEQPVKVVK